MSQICVTVPPMQAGQTIEMEVTINGKKQVLHYRVETFPWPEDFDTEQRIQILRGFLKDYDRQWELMQIGPPDGGLIPIMFRQKDEPRPYASSTQDASVA